MYETLLKVHSKQPPLARQKARGAQRTLVPARSARARKPRRTCRARNGGRRLASHDRLRYRTDAERRTNSANQIAGLGRW